MKYISAILMFCSLANAGTLTFEGAITNPSTNVSIPTKFDINTNATQENESEESSTNESNQAQEDCIPAPQVTVNGVEQDASSTGDGIQIWIPNPEPNKKYIIQVEY